MGWKCDGGGDGGGRTPRPMSGWGGNNGLCRG